jgi:hypothetical protein
MALRVAGVKSLRRYRDVPVLNGALNRHRHVLAQSLAKFKQPPLEFRAIVMPDPWPKIGPHADRSVPVEAILEHNLGPESAQVPFLLS